MQLSSTESVRTACGAVLRHGPLRPVSGLRLPETRRPGQPCAGSALCRVSLVPAGSALPGAPCRVRLAGCALFGGRVGLVRRPFRVLRHAAQPALVVLDACVRLE
jgi:hypothetical protein